MTAWIDQIFDAKIVKKDGIVRRKRSAVSKHASFDELLDQVKERGYHLVETGDQYVVFCNKGALKIHC